MATTSVPPTTSSSSGTHLQFDKQEFRSHFSREPFRIQHDLEHHPLFQIERLLELSKTLPEDKIEYNAGDLPVSIDYHKTPRNGLSSVETIRRIEECKSWMVLKNVEQDPEYAALLQACLAEIRPLSEAVVPGMQSPKAYIFLTSPGSVTPYHIDPEHNFLLQLRGSKLIHMLDGRDRTILTESELEYFYGEVDRNLKFQNGFPEKAWKFTLTPGQGLHFPVTYPHWVKNGDEVSISFSITFRTPDLEKRRSLYEINSRKRKRGGNPAPVGQHPFRDEMKYLSLRIQNKLRRLLGREEL